MNKFKEFATKQKLILIPLSIFLAVLGSALYFFFGYSILIIFLWLASIITAGICFHPKPKSNQKFKEKKYDFLIVIFLLILFVPIYLYNTYTIPFQVNTDEITIMATQKEQHNQSQPDIFSLSNYFGFPSFIFIVTGALGNLLGGINLNNMRVVHAFFGLLIIPSTYIFFRTFTKRKVAIAGVIILGINHSLVAISRMAMRENLTLLFGVLALASLIWGLKKRSKLHIFTSGVFAGLNWYGYYPGRSTIVICFLFLAVSLSLSYRQKYKFSTITKYGFIVLLSFMLVILPLITAMAKQFNDPIFKQSVNFQKTASLLHPEGRQKQKNWTDSESTSEGIRANIMGGLTAYNNFIGDQGHIYYNPGHGFTDPLTGALLWVGFLVILGRRKKEKIKFLILTSFVFYILVFSFIVNKAPNYTRLLVTLPFVACLAVVGLNYVSGAVSDLGKKLKLKTSSQIKNVIFILLLVIIVFWNLLILSDFVIKGTDEGDIVGGTARYIEDRKNIKGHSFYLAASKEKYTNYYLWDSPYIWRYRLNTFASDHQSVEVLSSKDKLTKISASPPFTIFISNRLWDEQKETLITKFPNYTIHKTKPDGSKLAIEIE